MKIKIAAMSLMLCISVTTVFAQTEPKWDLLSESEKQLLDRVLAHWETWVPARKEDGTAPMMTYEELYQGLDSEAVNFLERVKAIDPRKDFDFQGEYLGGASPDTKFIRIENQFFEKEGEKTVIGPQYLPENVYAAYGVMMNAMSQDLGKKLLIESGYRSGAYQLYTFLFYTPKHGYSLVETGKWVAIPGYSEHGAPHRQAIDFINEEGINGEDREEDFEELPEYQWLMENAGQFGFELSYPRDQRGITFEPWHWRYVKQENETGSTYQEN